MNRDNAPSFFVLLKSTHFGRVLIIGFLVMVLQIPVSMINDVVREREATSAGAGEEITSKWGREQTLAGPSLVIPYVKTWVEILKDGTRKTRREERFAKFLPQALEVRCKMDTETRYRGIFKVPVYSAAIEFSGSFGVPDFSGWSIENEEILWDRAVLSLGVSDARSITSQMTVDLGGRIFDFLPGPSDPTARISHGGIHAPVGTVLVPSASGLSPQSKEPLAFSITMNLNGSHGLFLAPLGKTTVVHVDSDWPDPSFQGLWLPSERVVGPAGFKASWSIPFLGRNYPQRWRGGDVDLNAVDASAFGVRLIQPVDLYRMSSRSVKYAVLFIVMTFLTLWLFEVLGSAKIHPVQYLMVGAAVCVFYLLELSMAEHVGFTGAYLAAAAAVVMMLTCYSGAVLGAWKRATAVMAVTGMLYSYLYVLLVNQDYALLIGSAGSFVTLGAVMYLTRRVDWGRMS